MEKIMTFAERRRFWGPLPKISQLVNYVQIHRFWRVFLNFGWMGVDWVWGVIERKCRVNQLAMSAASGFLLLLAATTSRIPKPPILLLLQDVTITFLLYTPTNIHNLLISIRQNRKKPLQKPVYFTSDTSTSIQQGNQLQPIASFFASFPVFQMYSFSTNRSKAYIVNFFLNQEE